MFKFIKLVSIQNYRNNNLEKKKLNAIPKRHLSFVFTMLEIPRLKISDRERINKSHLNNWSVAITSFTIQDPGWISISYINTSLNYSLPSKLTITSCAQNTSFEESVKKRNPGKRIARGNLVYNWASLYNRFHSLLERYGLSRNCIGTSV